MSLSGHSTDITYLGRIMMANSIKVTLQKLDLRGNLDVRLIQI